MHNERGSKRHVTGLRLCCWIGAIATCIVFVALLLVRRQTFVSSSVDSYTPLSGQAQWEGNWQFSELGADPSDANTERVTIPFTGTDLALTVRRGDYRGYLIVSVDGQPANRLPQAPEGAYLILTSPDRQPEIVTIPVAGGLRDEQHTASIVIDRGWTQWPFVGWEVTRNPDTRRIDWTLRVLTALFAVAATCAIWQSRRELMKWSRTQVTGLMHAAARVRSMAYPHWRKLREGRPGGAWLRAETITRKSFAGTALFALAAVAVFYFSPSFIPIAAGFLCLAVVIVLRPDIGLGLVLAAAPFYLYPRRVFGKQFSVAEIVLVLACVGHFAHQIDRWLKDEPRTQTDRGATGKFNGLDAAMIGLVLVGTISAITARYTRVAIRELRLVIVEPALLYWIIRTSRFERKAIWNLVDMLVLGTTVVAAIGLVQFGLNVNVITAEQGFRRLRSVYGSPNNAGLMLGRIIPLLLATVIWARHPRRRVGYALSCIAVTTAAVLTFSKGALLLGIPLGVLALGFIAGRPWSWVSIAVLVTAGVCAIPLLNTPRFASLLDSTQGTTFFRLQIWQSSLAMFRSAPIFGVGPDNFLYFYRGHFIRPAAWREPDISQAHNFALNFATRLGILGLTVAVWLQVEFWRRGLAIRTTKDSDNRVLALGLMGMMAAYLGHGLVDSSHFVVDLAYIFSFSLGLIQWLSRSDTHGIEK